MTRDDYNAPLRQALASPYGIALEFPGWRKAERARRRIYSVRDAWRCAGDDSFDILSVVVQPYGRLLIVRRDQLPRRDREDGLTAESHPLSRDELPDKFGYCNHSFGVTKPRKHT